MSSRCGGRRYAIVSIVILSVTWVALSASSACRMMERAEKLDSVLLITLDTLRADHVSCYGPSPVATPHRAGVTGQDLRPAPGGIPRFRGIFPP